MNHNENCSCIDCCYKKHEHEHERGQTANVKTDRKDGALNGVKYDEGKTMWSLVPWPQFKHVADVLTFGVKKYAPDNWKIVDDAKRRYFEAAHRHIYAWLTGEIKDPESGHPHLAHAICCLLFLMWFDDKH